MRFVHKALIRAGCCIPGSQRAKYIQYNFDAKLGIEGKDVAVESTQTHHLTVSIPKFIFIGYNNAKYQVVAENGGALSWTTPDIDPDAKITFQFT